MITQPDNKTTKIRLSVMPRCSLYYAKITQIESRIAKPRLSVMPRCSLYYAKITQIIGLTKSMQCFLKICQK